MAWINLLECIYPVGSVYLSIEPVSPASIVGGTWSKKETGCLACAGASGYADAGQSGGSSTISLEQMPSHNHDIVHTSPTSEQGIGLWFSNVGDGSGWLIASTGKGIHSIDTANTGGGRHINRCTSLFTFGSELLKSLSLLGGDLVWLG